MLNARQRRFVEVYKGNASEAAREAGYTGSANTLGQTGHQLLKNPKIIVAIKKREQEMLSPLISSRIRRQAFWSRTMNDKNCPLSDRLRASELLGKSEGDFVERHEVTGKNGKPFEGRKPVFVGLPPKILERLMTMEVPEANGNGHNPPMAGARA